jgi:glutamine synthetase
LPQRRCDEPLQRIPASLLEGLQALADDAVLSEGFGADFIENYRIIKRLEQDRFEAATDKDEFARREYFGRI